MVVRLRENLGGRTGPHVHLDILWYGEREKGVDCGWLNA